MAGVTVRQGRPDDDVDLVSVKRAAIEAGAGESYSAAELAAWSPDVDTIAGYQDALDADRFLVLVAEREEIVGYGVLNVERGSLLALYVSPDERDGGIGSTLLGQIETSAKFSGARTLDLLASQNAVGFYEAHGYERVGDVDREVHGESLDFVEMEKSLF